MGGARRAWRRVLGAPAAALLLTGGLTAGVLAVTVAPASAATDLVTTEAQFRTDFDSNSFDTLVLQNDIHLSVANCTRATRINGTNPLTIDGQGQFKIVQDCPGFGVLGVFSLGPGQNTTNLTLRGVTLTGATAVTDDDGGGLEFEGGSLTIDHSAIINNHVQSGNDGGGVDAEGTGAVSIIDSTFANNSADDDGGGLNCDSAFSVAPPSMTVIGSTFAGNSTTAGRGDSGAAIDMEVGPCALTLKDSTVTANTSGDDAAVTTERGAGPVTLAYDSIVNNATAPATPGAASVPATSKAGATHGHDRPESVHAENDTVAVATANLEVKTPSGLTTFGTVIARPHGGPNCADATGAPLTGIATVGFNLADDTSCGLTAGTDKQAAGLDPLVGPLASNGGPTQTVLPLAGSPLIDAIPPGSCQLGPAAGVTTDQRGIARPQGPGCDIGAVEVVAPLVVQPRFTG